MRSIKIAFYVSLQCQRGAIDNFKKNGLQKRSKHAASQVKKAMIVIFHEIQGI